MFPDASRMVLPRYRGATLKAGNRNPESGNQNLESGIRNPESGIENDNRKIHLHLAMSNK